MQIRISDADQNLRCRSESASAELNPHKQNRICHYRAESACTEPESANTEQNNNSRWFTSDNFCLFVKSPVYTHMPAYTPPPSKIPIWLHPHYPPPPPLPREHLPISPHYTLQRKQCGVPRQGEEGMGSGVKWGEECEELTPAHDTTTKHYHLTWYGVKQLVLIIQHLSQVLFVTLSL